MPYVKELLGLSSRPVLKIYSINQSTRLCTGFYRSTVNGEAGVPSHSMMASVIRVVLGNPAERKQGDEL